MDPGSVEDGSVAAPRLKYRPDVDGLRAVAVLLVLADHLRTRFGGGYIGVDVFFVISGYLISAVILKQLRAGRFSIVDFYERRVRRIFPALLVMLFATTVLAYCLFVPSEVVGYGRSLEGALFSVSNFVFWHESGYFDGPSLLKPLLHTWSLAVEEQFYILFPLLLVLVRRFFPKRMRAAILLIAGLSFVGAVVTVRQDATAAFFLAPLRAWELMIGTVVSQRYLPVPARAWTRNVASAAGLLMILVPAVEMSSRTQFPGLTALAPCLGAALIIAAGETGGSAVGSLLAWRPVVFIGLISYSLYLWHWPILVFQNTSSLMFAGIVDGSRAKLIVALVSIAVATLSWAFVEQPFRKGRFRPGRAGVFWINGVAVAVLAAAGVGMIVTHGLPGRFPPAIRQIAEYTSYEAGGPWREGVCFVAPGSANVTLLPQCLAQTAGRPSLLILGDSHGAQLYPGFAAVYADHDVLQATVAACRPLVVQPASNDTNCLRIMHQIFREFLPAHQVDTLVLAGRWAPYEMDALGQTVAELQKMGVHTVIVGPNIEYDEPLPRVLAMAARKGRPAEIEEHRGKVEQAFDGEMAALARDKWHVPYISIYADLCGGGACPLYGAPGVPLEFDTDHLTAAGSELLARAIRERHQVP